jgi:Protein of unknown function (DUF1759)
MPRNKETNEILLRTGNTMTSLIMQIDALKGEVLTYNEDDDVFTLEEEHDNVQDLKAKYQRQLQKYLAIATEAQVAERAALTRGFEKSVKVMIIHLKRRMSPHTEKTKPVKTNPIVRLRDMPLPSFNGDYSEWVYYKEQINALLITNKSLLDIQKLHYLKSTLTGEAKGIQSAQDTCSSLWDTLVQRYDIKRNIVENHIKALYN